jgi:DNA-binding winged helix-turn-helix (wHTH) protein
MLTLNDLNKLTPSELKVYYCLNTYRQTVSLETISHSVYGTNEGALDATIRVFIKTLRRKLGPNSIITHYRVGYELNSDYYLIARTSINLPSSQIELALKHLVTLASNRAASARIWDSFIKDINILIAAEVVPETMVKGIIPNFRVSPVVPV